MGIGGVEEEKERLRFIGGRGEIKCRKTDEEEREWRT